MSFTIDIAIKHIVIAILCIFIMIICIFQNNSNLMMYNDEYGNYFGTIIGAKNGRNAFFKILLRDVKKNKCLFVIRFVVWVGQNSLVIFSLHLLLLYFIRILLALIGLNKWPFSAGITLICLVPFVNILSYFKYNIIKHYKKL